MWVERQASAAREARLFILNAMQDVIAEPRSEMNKWAPRIESIEIPKDKIGEVIGPKGAVIRELEEETGANIEIEETDGVGIVRIASNDGDALAAAKEEEEAAAAAEAEAAAAAAAEPAGEPASGEPGAE